MFKFKKKSNKPTCGGSKIYIKSTVKYKGNNIKLCPIDEIDLQKKLNSYKDCCSLRHYLEKFGVDSLGRAKTAEALKKTGVFSDVSAYPADLLEAHKLGASAHASAEALKQTVFQNKKTVKQDPAQASNQITEKITENGKENDK